MILFIEALSELPLDSGPIYRETLMGRLPVEPFNTASNIVFLFIVIYFSVRVYKKPSQHLFLACAIPVLAIGFVGGTVYHATRSHEIWLLMDWVPIMILCMSAVFYFIFKLYRLWWHRLLACFVIFALSFSVRLLPIPAAVRLSLGYVITAITVLLPIFLYLIKTKGKFKELIILAAVFFAIAVGCRSADKFLNLDILYMGTHWLWHFFGGVSVFFLMKYVYQDNAQIVLSK